MSQTLTATSTRVDYQITNNAGVPVLLLQASAPANDLAIQLYDQSLTFFETGTPGHVLPDGASATVSLEDNQDGTDHSLIVAQADNLFPVAVCPLVFPGDGTNSLTITVSTADRKSMQLAEKFLQSIRALPDSDLATGYATALAGQELGSADRFFQGTQDFKEVRVNKVVAVQTYYNAFPYIWANYAKKKVYTLYNAGESKTQQIGSVTISSTLPVPASIDKRHTGFSLVYQTNDPDAGAVDLAYANGRFSNLDADSEPAVQLEGTFSLAANAEQGSSGAAIITQLKGTVNGMEVLGAVQDEDDSKPWISIDGLLHPEDLKDKLQLAGIAVGIAGSLAFVAAVVGGAIYKLVRRKARTGRTNRNFNIDDATSESEYESSGEGYSPTLNGTIPDYSTYIPAHLNEIPEKTALYTKTGEVIRNNALRRIIANQYGMLAEISTVEDNYQLQLESDRVDALNTEMERIIAGRSNTSFLDLYISMQKKTEDIEGMYNDVKEDMNGDLKTKVADMITENNDLVRQLRIQEKGKEKESSSDSSDESSSGSSSESLDIIYVTGEK